MQHIVCHLLFSVGGKKLQWQLKGKTILWTAWQVVNTYSGRLHYIQYQALIPKLYPSCWIRTGHSLGYGMIWRRKKDQSIYLKHLSVPENSLFFPRFGFSPSYQDLLPFRTMYFASPADLMISKLQNHTTLEVQQTEKLRAKQKILLRDFLSAVVPNLDFAPLQSSHPAVIKVALNPR